MTKEELTKLMLRGKGLSARAWKIRTLAKYDGEFSCYSDNCGFCYLRQYIIEDCKFCPLNDDSPKSCCLEWVIYNIREITENALLMYERIQSINVAKWVKSLKANEVHKFIEVDETMLEDELAKLEKRIENQERKYVS